MVYETALNGKTRVLDAFVADGGQIVNAFEKILNGLTYRHSIPAPSLVVVVSTRRAALDDNRASGGGKTELWLLLRLWRRTQRQVFD